MNETNITRTIQLAIGKFPLVRMFRNNVGTGWAGRMNRSPSGTVIIADARPLNAGLCVGSSDLIGWKTVTVTPEMVGNKIAIFTAIEVKTATGKPTKEQENFLSTVTNAGGIAILARSADDVIYAL